MKQTLNQVYKLLIFVITINIAIVSNTSAFTSDQTMTKPRTGVITFLELDKNIIYINSLQYKVSLSTMKTLREIIKTGDKVEFFTSLQDGKKTVERLWINAEQEEKE